MQAAIRSCARAHAFCKLTNSCMRVKVLDKAAVRAYTGAREPRRRQRISARSVQGNAEAQQQHGGPQEQRFRAQCHPGLEEVVAEELRQLPCNIWGIEFKAGKAGVDFRGASMEAAYHACIRLRAAVRILHLLGEGTMQPDRGSGFDELYAIVRNAAAWETMLAPGLTFGADVRMQSCTGWNHSGLAQTCIQGAVKDALRDRGMDAPERPEPGTDPTFKLFVTMFKDEVKVFRDVSGRSLHKRGYRGRIHKAALNEAAAAGILMLAGWPAIAERGGAMVDAMCGSGTLLLEAALIAHKVAPGLLRNEWALLAWPDTDHDAWNAAWESARAECQLKWPGVIAGCDIHQRMAAMQGSLALASESIAAANVRDSVRLRHGPCVTWKLPQSPDLVVTNPPWGSRLGASTAGLSQDAADELPMAQSEDWGVPSARGGGREVREMSDLEVTWRELQDFLKGQCAGSTAWVLCGNQVAPKYMGMKIGRRIPLTLGGADTRLLKYDIRDKQ